MRLTSAKTSRAAFEKNCHVDETIQEAKVGLMRVGGMLWIGNCRASLGMYDTKYLFLRFMLK